MHRPLEERPPPKREDGAERHRPDPTRPGKEVAPESRSTSPGEAAPSSLHHGPATVGEHDESDRAEAARLREEKEQLRRLLLDILEAPWAGTIGFANTQACVAMGHPRIHNDDKRPCCCGIVKPEREGEAT